MPKRYPHFPPPLLARPRLRPCSDIVRCRPPPTISAAARCHCTATSPAWAIARPQNSLNIPLPLVRPRLVSSHLSTLMSPARTPISRISIFRIGIISLTLASPPSLAWRGPPAPAHICTSAHCHGFYRTLYIARVVSSSLLVFSSLSRSTPISLLGIRVSRLAPVSMWSLLLLSSISLPARFAFLACSLRSAIDVTYPSYSVPRSAGYVHDLVRPMIHARCDE